MRSAMALAMPGGRHKVRAATEHIIRIGQLGAGHESLLRLRDRVRALPCGTVLGVVCGAHVLYFAVVELQCVPGLWGIVRLPLCSGKLVRDHQADVTRASNA